MKSFRYKHTPMVWALLFIVLALSIASIVWNVISLVNGSFFGSPRIIAYLLILIAGVFLCAFSVSVMLFSKYVVKNDVVVLRFGFIASKHKISEILQFTHFKKTDKLVAYFEDAKYTVIVISPNEYDSFVKTVKEINSKIIYGVESNEE